MTEAGHGASCLCGAVRIRISGKLRNVSNCHCGQCVKTHGHYAAYSAVDDGKIEIDGEESITWFRSSPMARRAFCKVCGSQLFWKADEAEYTSIAAGALDQPTGLTSDVHIFVANKPDYYEIADGLPKFAQDEG